MDFNNEYRNSVVIVVFLPFNSMLLIFSFCARLFLIIRGSVLCSPPASRGVSRGVGGLVLL